MAGRRGPCPLGEGVGGGGDPLLQLAHYSIFMNSTAKFVSRLLC